MSDYLAPLRDMKFVLRELAPLDALASLPGGDEVSLELATAILEEAGKFAREVIQTRRASLCEAFFDQDSLAVDVAEITKPLPECIATGVGWIDAKVSNPGKPLRLLRRRRERPRGCSAAEHGYEFPSSDVDSHLAPSPKGSRL